MMYQLMQSEEMKSCIELAAKAFEHYDFFSIYIPNEKRILPFLRSMLGVEFRVNQGLVHYLTAKNDGQIVAVAIVRSPSYQMPNEKQYLKSGFWKNLIIGGYRNVCAWYEMDLKAAIPCQEMSAKEKGVWFLHLLAVDVETEGKGIGSRMLQECVIPYVKEHGGKTLCLYTNSEINRRFYIKNGFGEFDATDFSYKGKTFGSWSYRLDLAAKE